jgi:hypothetical protein
MDAAPGFLRLGDHFDHLFKFGDAAAVRHGFAACGLDLFDHFQCSIRMACAIARTAEVVDHHFRAALGQFERIGTAQTAARTSHYGDFILEVDGHR